MKIYTVIPFFYGGEIYTNEVKSFTNFDDAQNYAWEFIGNKNYEIVENKLD